MSIALRSSRLTRLWKQRGALATLRFILTRIFRHEVHWVYAIEQGDARAVASWSPTEKLIIVTADNLAAELNRELESFLGGPMALENLRGVREGDTLFVVRDGEQYVHRGYALHRTRQKKLLGEEEATPLISYCFTTNAARGRGLYRRALAAELEYFLSRGCLRVAIETDPSNTASQKGIIAAGFRFSREVSAWILLNALIVRFTREESRRRVRLFLL
jgi:RimJ/RimL family protein N-acetyltransferase